MTLTHTKCTHASGFDSEAEAADKVARKSNDSMATLHMMTSEKKDCAKGSSVGSSCRLLTKKHKHPEFFCIKFYVASLDEVPSERHQILFLAPKDSLTKVKNGTTAGLATDEHDDYYARKLVPAAE